MKKMFVLMVALTIIAVPAFANMLANGDFETGDTSGWQVWSSSDPAWNPAPDTWGGPITVEVQYDVVAEGAYALHLQSNNASFGVVQAITTAPGTSYTISGSWKGDGVWDWCEVLFFNDDGQPLYKQLDAPLPSSVLHKVDGWGMNGPQPFGWEPIDGRWYADGPNTNTITATGTTMYVALKAGTSASAGAGSVVNAYYDGFSVTPVPEPSSLLALMSGIGALGFGLRRKIR